MRVVNTTYIVLRDDPRCGHRAVVGGKAASLYRMRKFGLRVPSFFVLSVDAYYRWSQGGMPGDLAGYIREALGLLSLETGLAVRSSAVDEDGEQASFAGIYHTSLQVKSHEEVLAAIEQCWRSFDAPEAGKYRERVADSRSDNGMAVIVQEMVAAEWAGVCFTADPTTGSLADSVIEAIPSLGEDLVSGSAHPERIVVDRITGMRRRGSSSHDASLPERILPEVWSRSVSFEEYVGFPQDLEWASRDGDVFFLQSRDIGTLRPIVYAREVEPWRDDTRAAPDDPERVWSRAYADEIWSPPISPLFYDVQNLTGALERYLAAHGDKRPTPPDVFKYHRAAAYVDVDVLRRLYEYQPRRWRGREVLALFPPPEAEAVERARFRVLGRVRRTLAFELRLRASHSLARNHEVIDRQWPEFVEMSDGWFDKSLDALSLAELRTHLAEVEQVRQRVAGPCGTAVFYHAIDIKLALLWLLDRWYGEGQRLYAEVSTGLECSATVGESDSIWQIAQNIREAGEEARDAALMMDWEPYATWLHSRGLDVISERFLDFLRSHRHRGANYKDLIFPRWGDKPDLLFDAVKGQLASGTPASPREVSASSMARRRETVARLKSEISGVFAPIRRRFLEALLKYNEYYMRQRDEHRYYHDRAWYQLRRIYRSLGKRLAVAGAIDDPHDVFFLARHEIWIALGERPGRDLRARVSTRRQEWEKTQAKLPPRFLRGRSPLALADERPVRSRVLDGVGASPGEATGRARVLRTVGQLASAEGGDIVVARQTDASWTAAFTRIGALVLETGGTLAHGASLCREFGLPCVTGIENATDRIEDGARIRVSGDHGYVEILH